MGLSAATAVHRLWPGWQHLPRDARDTLFLLGVIAWTVLPHAGHLPPWCIAMAASVLLWRGALALRSAALPGRWLMVGVLLAVIGLTFWTHRTLVGKEAGVTLLVALMALKTLELRARRDAFVVFFLGFFLVLTHFLYSQTIAVAAVSLVSVWGLLAALVLALMPVGQPSLAQAARLAARFALLGAPVMVALFLLFPRVGPLWGVPIDAGAKTGLSGEMRMGMIAELAADDSIAMRLRVLSGPLPPPQALYFRGPVLGAFDGTTWRVLAERPGRPAHDLYLTLDLTFQQAAEAAVGERVGAIVGLDPLGLTLLGHGLEQVLNPRLESHHLVAGRQAAEAQLEYEPSIRTGKKDAAVLLDVQNLSVHYVNNGNVAKAVHNVSFQLHEGSCWDWWGRAAAARRPW